MKNETKPEAPPVTSPTRKYREVRVRCYGEAEAGTFAELENGDRIYGLTGAAPELLTALRIMLAESETPVGAGHWTKTGARRAIEKATVEGRPA